ncbi:DNA repair protein rhp41 [Talaromyces islandicus]|uniref:DNA repair protein rhp41 n=1 Tax=Talaromyces islandicus TaxID=28573 RepID=A0A0U1M6X9_TALIS|nr:DNA repair protein rhp41 [Talaromyces islandicus]
MPPTSSARGRRRRVPARGGQDRDSDIPEVYREMLAEAEARAASEPQGNTTRPLKRRRVGERAPNEEAQNEIQEAASPAPSDDSAARQVQTAYDLDASGESDEESDMEWEEVVIQQPGARMQTADSAASNEPLQITLGQSSEQPRPTPKRRKPVSGAEKRLRLDIHKVHVLCLLQHVYIRNLWCNDDETQKSLKKILNRQIIGFLNPKETLAQFNRSTTFIDGLKQASEAFARKFKVTAPGMRRPHWVEDSRAARERAELIIRDAETLLSKEDFRKQAEKLQGSRDFGAQLFCAMLRSAAVEARLVCSIQVLPFSGVAKGMSPEKPKRDYIVISSDDDRNSAQTDKSSKPRRLGQPLFKSKVTPFSSYAAERPRNFLYSPYPVFWVEAFNEAVQKWVPVDPLVTKTVAKYTKFEPPASDRHNSMSYVLAFEEDASARDVTKRYTKAFNAKTRKTRVESTKDGENWWTTVMNHFEKPFPEDRDQLETSELTAKAAAEPMPRNIQDFKDHPIYALERHLRRNEVIHPKRATGQVEVSKSSSKKNVLEPVYRRADVHVVRSADGWYRLGRDIKIGEQPLKRVTAAISRNETMEDDEDLAPVQTALYAIHQTELYRPPPVVRGKIPKNAYGNLDVYVPSMIPQGAFHLKHPEAVRAARTIGVDYAEAVTGFEFKGRRGTAVFNGIVAAVEYRDALEEVIRCMEDEKIQAELERRTQEALRLWRHFLRKLRIAEKVKQYAAEGEDVEEDEVGLISEDDVYQPDPEEEEGGGGGFLPESDGEVAEPTSNPYSNTDFVAGSNTGNISPGDGGGFIPDDDALDGGGFMPEAETKEETKTVQPEPIPEPATSTMVQPRRKAPRYRLIVVSEKEKHSDAVSSAPFDLTEDTPEPAQDEDIDEGFSNSAPIVIDSSTGPGSTSASVEVLSRPQSRHPSRAASPQRVDDDSDSSNAERGSLLSHDPEDDDAEPEWLLSD